MLYTYRACIDKYGSDYRIKKEIERGTLFMKEKGIYSTVPETAEIDVIMLKYPKSVCTGRSAFFYHSLTDEIPEFYYLATRREDYRINDVRVKQSFMNDNIFSRGIDEIQYNNSQIRIYDKERMLVELLRFRKKIPMDYYKEIILNYRKQIDRLDIGLVEDYAFMFKNGEGIMRAVQMEVL